MIKAIVVASSFSQYATYLRNRGFNRSEYGYFSWRHPEKCFGLNKRRVKVLWLEGWSDNPEINADGKNFLDLFSQHQNVSEVWIYGQGTFF